jgi:K+-transporting ATPase ATPase C chain
MWRELGPGFRFTLAFTVLTGLLYPLAMTGVSELLFPHRANGSLVRVHGVVVGSSLIGQAFSQPQYFQPRPSEAGAGYDATQSGGSNLGPTSAKLILGATIDGRGTPRATANGKTTVAFDGIEDRLVHYCLDNGLPYTSSQPLSRFEDADGKLDDVKLIEAFREGKDPLVFKAGVPIPSDAVTGSASGLDPEISPANARLQLARVAKARGVAPGRIRPLLARYTEPAAFGFLGEPGVNVLELNLALDREFPRR